jgi:hypothetical protein
MMSASWRFDGRTPTAPCGEAFGGNGNIGLGYRKEIMEQRTDRDGFSGRYDRRLVPRPPLRTYPPFDSHFTTVLADSQHRAKLGRLDRHESAPWELSDIDRL